jgi:hypothetical protein
MFRITIDNEYKFFNTIEEAIQTIKDIYMSDTCIFQKVTNWTRVTKNNNCSCQITFIKIENGLAKTFSKSILWLGVKEKTNHECYEDWTKRWSEEWNKTIEKLLKIA